MKSTSRKVTPSAGKTILVATDDSPSARLAFALVVTKLANRGKDLVHVYTNSDNLDHVETMLKKYVHSLILQTSSLKISVLEPSRNFSDQCQKMSLFVRFQPMGQQDHEKTSLVMMLLCRLEAESWV